MSEDRVIAVSGSPGTGKSTFARKLSEDLDYKLIDLNEIIEEENVYELDADGTRAVDSEDLRAVFKNVLAREGEDMVVEGLLSHLLSRERVSEVVVLRTNPEVLEKRLRKRGYSDEKLQDNLEAEALDVVLGEAIQEHGVDGVYEIDTTRLDPSEAVSLFEGALEGRESLAPGSVDWLEEYFGEGSNPN